MSINIIFLKFLLIIHVSFLFVNYVFIKFLFFLVILKRFKLSNCGTDPKTKKKEKLAVQENVVKRRRIYEERAKIAFHVVARWLPRRTEYLFTSYRAALD